MSPAAKETGAWKEKMGCLPSHWRRTGVQLSRPSSHVSAASSRHRQTLIFENTTSIPEKGIFVFPLLLTYFPF